MAVQKRRQSKARRDQRRAHWMRRTGDPNASACGNCGSPRLSHRVCPACGHYGGKQVKEGKSQGDAE